MEPHSRPDGTVPGRAWSWAPVTYPLIGCLFMTVAGMVGTVIDNPYLTFGGVGAAAACGLVSLTTGAVALAADYSARLKSSVPLIGTRHTSPAAPGAATTCTGARR